MARPTVSGNSPYEVSSYVIDDGGRPIVEKGFEYIINWGGGWGGYSISCGSGSFQGQISTNNTLEKVRAYASNGVHTGYSGWAYVNKRKIE